MVELSAAGPPSPRLRGATALAAVVVFGLASRRWPLPGPFAEHTGDAAYAMAAFFLLRVVAPDRPRLVAAAAAFGFSAAVEASQALRWQWLVDLRATRTGALCLGQGFQWADLVAYAIGVAVAVAIDRRLVVAAKDFHGPLDPRTPPSR